MSRIVVAVASYSGIADGDVRKLVSADHIESLGHEVLVVKQEHLALLDLARAEVTTKALALKPDYVLFQDDDVAVAGKSFEAMLMADVDCVAALYWARHGEDRYVAQIKPGEKLIVRNHVPLIRVVFGGLGCVLVKAGALKRAAGRVQSFNSFWTPGATCAHLFGSMVVPRRTVVPGAPKGENSYLPDDVSFFRRMQQAGVNTWAAVLAETMHGDLKGRFGETCDLKEEIARATQLKVV